MIAMSRTRQQICEWLGLASLVLLIGCSWCLEAASQTAALITEGDPVTALVKGRPFAAVKYSRQLRIEKSGKWVVTQSQGHTLIARDADGRITMTKAELFGESCDMPNLGTLPPCQAWRTFIFDPVASTMWHWDDGPLGHTSQLIQMRLQSNEIVEAERLTSALQISSVISDPAHGIFVQDLGKKNIEGVPATGVRLIVDHTMPSKAPDFTFHEVWTARQMQLTLMVINGDAQGNETISGLDHISLNPAKNLFQPPLERGLMRYDNGEYAVKDFAEMEEWFVGP